VADGLSTSVDIWGVSIAKLDLLTVALTAVLLVSLTLFLGRSAMGVQMRAAAENFSMARVLGVRANVVIAAAFCISGLLAGSAAFLLVSQSGTVAPNIGVSAVLIAFVATIVGGLGSLSGAVLGGYVIGALTVTLQIALPLEMRPYRDAAVFGVVLLVLIVRPQGLLVSASAVSRIDAPTVAARIRGAASRSIAVGAQRLWTPALLVGLVTLTAVLASLGPASLERAGVTMLVNLTLVVGLYLFVGNSGVFSFGHMAFMGIGAYAASLLVIPVLNKQALFTAMPAALQQAHLGTIGAILAAAAVAAAVALLLAGPLMRLSGLAASIATFAVLVIVYVVANSWKQVTNASAGMFGIPTTIGLWFALAVAVLAILGAFAFQQTRVSLRLRASREDEVAARTIGVRLARDRSIAFVASAAVMGIGGALYAQSIGSVQPDVFYIGPTFLVIAMLVVGGMTSLSGAVVGTLTLSIMSELLRRIEEGVPLGPLTLDAPAGLREVGFGVVLLVVLARRPTGIMAGRELELRSLRVLTRRLRSGGALASRLVRRESRVTR
jgi:branched-chain amino acid transport system permease protein